MKMTNKILHVKSWLLKRSLVLCAMVTLTVTNAFCQLPTAQQVASQMKVGWNLGNTLEAICAEDAWSNAITTQTLINSVKTAGFNTIRVPCAWDCHSSNGVIDAAWIARVKEVVDYCINNDMYVILNIHWDNGWLDEHINSTDQSSVIAKQKNYWTQIANYFKAYDEHLLFAGSNEPPVNNASEMTILLSYHQAFIDAVRATGGNNSSRTLIVQGPSADIEKTNNLMNSMPTDQISNRLMVEVHYYTPYQFCLMESDQSWGNMAYYWGNGYHSSTETSRNATWGEESDIEYYFGLMKTKFTDKGIPVLLGEFAAMKRSTPADLSLHLASRAYFHKYVVSSAIAKGIIPVYWDHGQSAFAIFNRSTGAVVDQQNLTAIMQGAGNTKTYYTIKARVSGKLLDVSDASQNDNASIIQWSANGDPNQQFEMVNAGSGYINLKARHSGKAIRAVNGKAVQYTFNSSYWSEMFERVSVGNGYYLLKARGTNSCLRVENSSGSNGASIVLNTCNTSYWSQHFSFTAVANSYSEKIVTAMETKEVKSISVYPNPLSDGKLSIDLSNATGASEIKIVDLSGKVLKQISTSEQSLMQMDVDAKPGVYMIQISNNNNVTTEKLIIK